jgi:TRAP-type C4-dicarboxylate transport system substrate-binding protein
MRALAPAILLLSTVAQAEPITLRMASIAPDGTAWAHELRAFAREVETVTLGRVRMKWYFGAMAGDETSVLDRIRRGQLDGEGAGHACDRLAPTLNVMRLVGLLRTRAEERYVLQRLRDDIDAEFAREGFVALGAGSLGIMLLWSRTPVRSMIELRRLRWWVSDQDEYIRGLARSLGLKLVPTTEIDAGRAYDEGQLDGFIAIPSSLLAFQWSSRVRNFTELPMGSINGCLLVSQRALARLDPQDQVELRAAGAKATARLDDIADQQQQLVPSMLVGKQAIERVVPDEPFRAAFYDAAKNGRARQIDPALLARVLSLLADYRAEHSADR